MAKRPFFISTPNSDKLFLEKTCEFTYYSGFAISQNRNQSSLYTKTLRNWIII